MTLDQLKGTVETYRQSLKGKSGKMVVFGESGPASIGLIDAIVATIETLQKRVEDVERRTGK